MKQFLINGLKHWKTTLQSLLTVAIAASVWVAAHPQDELPSKISAGILMVGSIAKIIVGISQTDTPDSTKET